MDQAIVSIAKTPSTKLDRFIGPLSSGKFVSLFFATSDCAAFYTVSAGQQEEIDRLAPCPSAGLSWPAFLKDTHHPADV
jgi:hypothetical protein